MHSTSPIHVIFPDFQLRAICCFPEDGPEPKIRKMIVEVVVVGCVLGGE